MKKWREYSENLSEYYGWYPKERKNTMDTNLISYNVTSAIIDKEEFFNYCLQQIKKDIVRDENIYVYLVVAEEVRNPNSKVERYKKCWKKLSNFFTLDFMQLSEEIEYLLNDMLYYIAIAKTDILNLNKVLKIIDARRNKYFMFISNKDYLKEIEDNHIAISDFIVLNSFGEIDYLKVIEKCSKNHDLACCYGLDSTGAELALIFNTQDKWKYFSNNN